MARFVASRRLLWLAGLLMLGTPSALADSVVDPNQQVHALIQQLNAEGSEMARYELASELAGLVHATEDKTQFRDETIDEIVALLNDRSASSWAALALAQIGPLAARTVPALEAALHKERLADADRAGGGYARTGIWTSDVICFALRQLGRVEHAECRT